MTDFLKNITVEYWYKMIVVAALFFLFISLTTPLVGVSNQAVQLLSLGAFFIGIGEWINHPLQTRLEYNLKITSRNRLANFTGLAFDALGGLICGLGLMRLM